jgi:hypothetical protein
LIVTANFGAGFGPRDWKRKSLSGMDDTGGIFGLLAKHMAWLGQRQSLVAKRLQIPTPLVSSLRVIIITLWY